jgi:D-alanine-D-alanine ligase
MSAAILYAESEFTPWKENIDLETVETIFSALPNTNNIEIIHMKNPDDAFGKLLATYDTVINMCYGYMEYSQAFVASWLDEFHVRHLSSSGFAQKRVEDKMWVEKCCLLHDIPVPKSVYSVNDLDESLHIIKPRFGSCHRDMVIIEGQELKETVSKLNTELFVCQPYLFGREFSVAVIPSDNGLEHIALPPVEIVPVPKRDLFVAGNSFGITQREFSFELNHRLVRKMMDLAVKLHELAGLRYMSRLDFRISNDEVYVLDLNAMPNLHPTKSLLPLILAHNNISLKELFRRKLKMKSIREGLSRFAVLGKN